MQREDINPWEWSKAFGFSQAVALGSPERVLVCSGQTAVDADGSPPTTDDIEQQVRIAMANLAEVLSNAGMTMADIVRLTIFTTDVDGFIGASEATAGLLLGNLPAMTLIGVSRLAYPQLKVEIEAIAAK